MNVCSCSFTSAFSIFLSAPCGGWCLSLQPMNPFLSKGEGFCRIIENFNLTYTNPCLSHCTKFRGRNERKIQDIPFFVQTYVILLHYRGKYSNNVYGVFLPSLILSNTLLFQLNNLCSFMYEFMWFCIFPTTKGKFEMLIWLYRNTC